MFPELLNKGILTANEDLHLVGMPCDFDSSYREFHFFFKTQAPTSSEEIDELLVANGIQLPREVEEEEEEGAIAEAPGEHHGGAVLVQ
jgi:hypothetical protein